MKLFLKHIFRSVNRSPLQPLLILLTVVLSVSVGITAFRMRDLFADHAASEAQKDINAGDILISIRSDSRVRMLFCEDVQDIIGEENAVLGEYALTVFSEFEGETCLLSAAATDLVSADRYFGFEYVEYGRFTEATLDSSVVISESLSRMRNLHVGDTLTVSFLEQEQSYTVQAVARDSGLLWERDVLIPISGVIGIFADRVPPLAVIEDTFAPCNRLMIRVSDTAQMTAVFQSLSASPRFSDYHVELVRNDSRIDYNLLVQNVSITLLMLLLTVLCALLISTSLYLLRLQREGEYALFCSAGASRRHLWTLQILESVGYALLGGMGGITLAYPMMRAVDGFFVWESTPLSPRGFDIVFGFSFSLIFMTACTVYDLWRKRHLPLSVRLSHELQPTTEDSFSWRAVLTPSIIAIALLLSLFVIPRNLGYLPAVGACLALIRLLYVISPYALRALSRVLQNCLERKKRVWASGLLAVKNLQNHKALRYTVRLLSVILALLITVLAIVTVVEDQQLLLSKFVTAEVLMVNAPEDAVKELQEDPAVEGVVSFDVLSGVRLPNGYSAIVAMFSGDTADCFEERLVPSHLPTGDEAVISNGIAYLLNVGEGDRLELTVQGKLLSFVVASVEDIPANLIYLSRDAVSTSREMTAVKLRDGVDSLKERERIVGELELYGAVAMETEILFGTLPQSLHGFVRLLRWTISVSAVLALVGSGNILAAQYRLRRWERHLLRVSGMTRRQLLGMHATELLLIVALAVLLAVLFGGIICLILDVGVHSFGFSLL